MAKSKTTPNGPTGVLESLDERTIRQQLVGNIVEAKRALALLHCIDELKGVRFGEIERMEDDELQANVLELEDDASGLVMVEEV